MQALLLARLLGSVFLQEFPVGIELDSEQVRDFQDTGTLTEVLSDPLLFGEGIRHEVAPLYCYALSRHADALDLQRQLPPPAAVNNVPTPPQRRRHCFV